ncbi:TIGR03751 family conjugal transfer lipoprotein [Chitinimonas lacunae]|uniref:TIGR03751 family conjugal transfer lipoprotein n=1 Tax=Chitinimonas lacunae TaxID=1963018 RepID=A0ABV8MST1_9NEIS
MSRIWIKTAALLAVAAVSGCATNKAQLLAHHDRTMLDIWQQETGGQASGSVAARQLLDARLALRRPLTERDHQAAGADRASHARTARDEIAAQFRRLPNPDLVMYVFPHLAGSLAVPVPGYSTVFPLHARVPYALPGERLEDY